MGLLRVFYAPEKVFAELPQDRAWVVPVVAVLILALLSSTAVINLVGMETITRMQIESNPRMAEQLGPQKIDDMAREAGASTVRKVLAYAAGVVFTGVIVLIIAGVLLGLMHIADVPARFGRVLAVCSYSYFAYALVTGVMSVAILAATSDYTGMDLQALVRLNPTLFLDKTTTNKALYSVLNSLDLLTFWAIFLIALGLSKIGPKLRLGKAIALVIAPWAVFVIGKAGLAMVF